MNKNLLSAVSFSPKSLAFPYSWVGHIPFVYFLVQEVRPKIFVELGTHTGNSYFAFCQAISENGLDTKCYAVDTWGGDDHAGKYDNDVYLQVNDYNIKNYVEFSTLFRMTFDDALGNFENGSIDLLHIDGLHTYESVQHDFESWLPKLAPGAVVIFHDTQVRERGFGVWKLWKELQVKYSNNIEFSHSHGLGVLQLENSSVRFLSWLTMQDGDKSTFKEYFFQLGERLFEKARNKQLIAEKDLQIAEKDLQIAEKDLQIKNILNSNSWKLTSPLRTIGKQLRKFCNWFKKIEIRSGK